MAEEELIEITIKKRVEPYKPKFYRTLDAAIDLQAAMDAFQVKKAERTYEESADYLFMEWKRLAGIDDG